MHKMEYGITFKYQLRKSEKHVLFVLVGQQMINNLSYNKKEFENLDLKSYVGEDGGVRRRVTN